MSILKKPSTADLLLLYPCESLREQVRFWRRGRPRRRVKTSFERSLPEIRGLLRGANAALVDATDDPSQATDAFLQAVARLGSGAVAVYSEAAHDGLEVFVRLHGPLYLLGPLFAHQWAEFFERFLKQGGLRTSARFAEGPRLPPQLRFDREARLRRWFERRFRDHIDNRFRGAN